MNTTLAATEVAVPHRDRGSWIQTYTGRAFHYADPQPDDIHIEDIALALSNLCRFAGHCRFYSVAEHSVHVSRQFASPELRMIGLLHDATEAYVVDVPKPLKDLCPDYKRIEHAVWCVIAKKFGLPEEIPAEIHDIDSRMLITERGQLFSRPLPWPKYATTEPLDVKLDRWAPSAARIDFLAEYRHIEFQR